MPLSEDTDPLRFVKTGHAPLSQKALEQLRMASEQATSWAQQRLKMLEEEETEDWQSKLANWKDRRRQQMPQKSIDGGTPPHVGERETDTSSGERNKAAGDAAQKGSPQTPPQRVDETRKPPQKTTAEDQPPPKLAQAPRPKPQPPPKPSPKPYPKAQPKQQPQPIQRTQNPSAADQMPQTIAPPVLNRTEDKKNGKRREEYIYGRMPPSRQWGNVWQQGSWEESASGNTLKNTYDAPQYYSARHDTQEGKYNGNYVHSERSYTHGNEKRDSERGYKVETPYSSTRDSTAYSNAQTSLWNPGRNQVAHHGRRSEHGTCCSNGAMDNVVPGDHNCNACDQTVTTSTSLLSEFSSEPVPPRDMSRSGVHSWGTRHPPPLKQEDPPPPVPEAPVDLPLSVSGRQRCSHCRNALGHGAAMVIESLGLLYHLECFRCCVCSAPLGNGRRGTDVRVRNTKLHCCNCYSNDEAGLQLSRV